MITRFRDGDWEGLEVYAYKDNPGNWQHVTRQKLNQDSDAAFDVRYFECAVGGYTSFERHEHEHFVVVVKGVGAVRLGDQLVTLNLYDAVRVPGHTPHQFRNTGSEPFGILCVVDRERDRPVHLRPDGTPEEAVPT